MCAHMIMWTMKDHLSYSGYILRVQSFAKPFQNKCLLFKYLRIVYLKRMKSIKRKHKNLVEMFVNAVLIHKFCKNLDHTKPAIQYMHM